MPEIKQKFKVGDVVKRVREVEFAIKHCYCSPYEGVVTKVKLQNNICFGDSLQGWDSRYYELVERPKDNLPISFCDMLKGLKEGKCYESFEGRGDFYLKVSRGDLVCHFKKVGNNKIADLKITGHSLSTYWKEYTPKVEKEYKWVSCTFGEAMCHMENGGVCKDTSNKSRYRYKINEDNMLYYYSNYEWVYNLTLLCKLMNGWWYKKVEVKDKVNG